MTDEKLVAALERIAARANRAVRSLEQGTAVNGHSALEQIRNEAEDAIRHHEEDAAEADGSGRFAHAPG